MSDGETHGERIADLARGSNAKPVTITGKPMEFPLAEGAHPVLSDEDREAAFCREVDAFFSARNPLLYAHRDAVENFGTAVHKVCSLEHEVKHLQEQLENAQAELSRAKTRATLKQREVEQAMGNLLDHQDKRPRRATS